MPRRTAPTEPETPESDAPETEATATEAAATEAPDASAPGFFGWLERLDVSRRPGWLGGVCAGIAARLGVDPTLVRGVAVVIAVLGGPVALLYALAWFLLPDENGAIHARELSRGRVTPALAGIVAVFLASFLPLAQGFWFAGSFYWVDLGWAGAVARMLWTGALIAALVIVVVWLARRAATSDIPTTPATTDDKPDTVPTFPVDVEATTIPAPGEPPPPPTDASSEELAAWKESQDEWQRQRATWVAEQRRTDHERRQAEARERSVAALEAARERSRLRKLTRPRARAGIVALVLGVGSLAGASAAAVAYASPSMRGTAWLVGAGVLTLVLGVGIVAVGLARRRSGVLSFFGILSVIALLAAVALPPDRSVLPLGASWGLNATVDGRYAQLAGDTQLYVQNGEPAPDGAPIVDLWQYAGAIRVDLLEGATVRIEYVTDSSGQRVAVEERYEDGVRVSTFAAPGGRLDLVVGDGEPDMVLRVWGGQNLWVTVGLYSETSQAVLLRPEPTTIDEWGELPLTPEPTEGGVQ